MVFVTPIETGSLGTELVGASWRGAAVEFLLKVKTGGIWAEVEE